MHSAAKKLLLLAGLVAVVGLVAWPGCIPASLPTTRTPIAARKKADFAYTDSSARTRSEVTARLGQPDAYVDDIRVACYRVNSVTKRDGLFLVVIPLSVNKNTNDLDIGFVQFDQQDRVQRSGIGTGYVSWKDGVDFARHAKEWLAAEEKKKRSR
jgi:hypothetical protein